MRKRINIGFIALLTFVASSYAAYGQRKMTREEYIDAYKEIAMRKMVEYRIPASITLAQGILESGCGGSILAVQANNHFGIKCHKEWAGEGFLYDDDAKNECFRVYKDAEESFNDHSLFLTTRDRYKPLFELKADDYEAWAHGLKRAGYATNPQYAHLLIKIIDEQQLYLYDRMALQGNFFAEATTTGSEQEGNTVAAASTFIPKQALPEYEVVGKSTYCGREIYKNNGVKFVFAQSGDTYYNIARDFKIYDYQLFSYNEKSKKSASLQVGEIVYLEKKKNKSAVDFYFVQPEDNMHAISQKLGVSTKTLYKKNRMQQGEEPAVGTMLWVSKKKS